MTPSSMHCVFGLLFKTSVCGVIGTPEAAARFRQTDRYYCLILEQFVLQNVRVKAQSGFRVTIE